jgi:hypothetical protein
LNGRNIVWLPNISPNLFYSQSLTDATLQKYKVKVTKDHTGLILPVFNPDGTLVRVRIMTVARFKVKDKERSRVVTDTLPK